MELADGPGGVVALVMMEGDGAVDEGLKEEAAGAGCWRPEFFDDFVALEEMLSIE